MTKSTASAASHKGVGKRKPSKPYPEFPLYAHATRRWAKKILGETHYFGHWDDWRKALEEYQWKAEALHSGRTPRAPGDGLTVEDLCNQFLVTKELLKNSGDLSIHTFNDYLRSAKLVVEEFGRTRFVDDVTPTDFAKFRKSLTKTRGPVALGNQITRTRVIFNYAFNEGLVPIPIRFGSAFSRPSKKVLRQARHAKGLRMFERLECPAW